ncbi:MAG: hypothetical protein Q7R22_009710 [Verrucomicrobiota bacterium JB025]|nr:hypothetical protein [Verrucomicrobiota bacterium JB025]
MSDQRYTRDGSDALESLIDATCREVGAEVERIVPAARLQALALGGGYGRGEGGVLKTPHGDAPYNDLEFFLLIQGPPRLNEKRFGHAIHELEHRMTGKIGIEVEIKITSLEAIASGPTTMHHYDLVEGHRIFAGPADALAPCHHHADPSRIPPHEATRLLMNRCSGLLFARERLNRKTLQPGDADFATRNIAKAQLALGDALLASKGLYHWSCVKRHEALAKLRDPSLPLEKLTAFHKDGVDFKLHPYSSEASRAELATLHEKVLKVAWPVWQTIEETRLGRTFPSPSDYARGPDKCPETKPLKNALIRLRAFGPKGLLNASATRYPREALLNVLPVLLWETDAADSQWLGEQLVAPVSNWSAGIAAYQNLWEKYN